MGQDIKAGDLVQMKVGYTPPAYVGQFEGGDMLFDFGEVMIVESVESDGVVVEGLESSPIPFAHVVRVGRAVVWPNGSLVDTEVAG